MYLGMLQSQWFRIYGWWLSKLFSFQVPIRHLPAKMPTRSRLLIHGVSAVYSYCYCSWMSAPDFSNCNFPVRATDYWSHYLLLQEDIKDPWSHLQGIDFCWVSEENTRQGSKFWTSAWWDTLLTSAPEQSYGGRGALHHSGCLRCQRGRVRGREDFSLSQLHPALYWHPIDLPISPELLYFN